MQAINRLTGWSARVNHPLRPKVAAKVEKLIDTLVIYNGIVSMLN